MFYSWDLRELFFYIPRGRCPCIMLRISGMIEGDLTDTWKTKTYSA